MSWRRFNFFQPCRFLPLHVAILSNVELLHLREDWMTLMLQVLALLAEDELHPLGWRGHWGTGGMENLC